MKKSEKFKKLDNALTFSFKKSIQIQVLEQSTRACRHCIISKQFQRSTRQRNIRPSLKFYIKTNKNNPDANWFPTSKNTLSLVICIILYYC